MSNCNSNGCNFGYYNGSSNCYDPCSGLTTCYDFIIKRHDAIPEFKLEISDCDEPIDLTNLIAEASMWSCAKLKSNLTEDQTVIQFADNIGFDQILINTIIQAGIGRNFERMKVIGFDEIKKEVYVERGYKSTTPFPWKKGTNLKLLRFLSVPAITELIFEDITNIDGSILKNQLTHSYLIYEWRPEDTSLAGCFYFEFKILKMVNLNLSLLHVPSNPHPHDPIEWTRRFPNDKDGFIIQVYNSPTGE